MIKQPGTGKASVQVDFKNVKNQSDITPGGESEKRGAATTSECNFKY